MTILKKTSDCFNGKGIFSFLDSFDVPWKDEISPQSLDDDYYGNHSGSKSVSPLVENFLDDDSTLTDSMLTRLATTIIAKYNDGWIRAWDALKEEYDPLHNYDGTETYNETETIEGSNTGTQSDSGSRINTGTQGIQGTDTGTVTHDIDDDETVSGTNTGTVTVDETTNNTPLKSCSPFPHTSTL